MAVTVEGQRDCGMSETFLDLFWMGALRDQQRRARVSQVMEPVPRTVAFVAVASGAETEVRVETGLHESRKVVPVVEVAT